MNAIFVAIVVFLIVLAVFDLVVGVSNDAVNFLNSAIGSKAASFRTIVAVAAVGVFAGASMSNGMMDVARHGIMTPQFFSFFDVMCVFLAVMVTDVILLDVFNSLGMPTSTTVSMVFELLGGSFAIAIIKIAKGATDASGKLLSLGNLINTEKAISVILGIFLSVAIAFVLGAIVQWIARMVFTFTYRVNGKTTSADGDMGGLTSSSLKIGIFSGISVTAIIWFLLINGLKGSSFMTPELKQTIADNTWYIIGGGIVVFSLIMTLLSALKVPVLKVVVLLGTFALAMAFAGNDLVNFVGVPLTGLDSFQDYLANGNGDPNGFLMSSLMTTAHTPVIFLILAGAVMVLSLIFSKKAQNVVKTSVDLSRQDEGDEMFGSSAVARGIVRTSANISNTFSKIIPKGVTRWVDSRFNQNEAKLPQGAAFDLIRASVNLVLAGILVALGTSLKLPLSTTYVTFMVAMGTSLADRAWGRESAVFRITGVISVIGGWFITAGVAFTVCYLVTNCMFFGKFIAMVLAIILAVFILIKSNSKFSKKQNADSEDVLFKQILKSKDEKEAWPLVVEHVRKYDGLQLEFVYENYKEATDSFFNEKYFSLKSADGKVEQQRKELKRQRRREILSLRKIDPVLAIEKNTWYFLSNNAVGQTLYCLKRIEDPCREHLGNNFSPVPDDYIDEFIPYRDEVLKYINMTRELVIAGNYSEAESLRAEIADFQTTMSGLRKEIIDELQHNMTSIETMTVFLNIVQESNELLGCLRHLVRGLVKFEQ